MSSAESEQEKRVWKERADRLLGEKEGEVQPKIEELKRLASKEEGLTLPPGDEFYIKFLRGGLMEPVAALTIIKYYFSLRKQQSQYFKNCLSLDTLVTSTFSQQIHAMLEQRDIHGRRVYVFRPGRWDPSKISFDDLFCAGYCLCEMTAREEKTQIAGYSAICDASGFGWKQLRAISLEDGKNLAGFFNVSFPIWLHQTHVLSAPRVFHMLFAMLSPFLSASVRDTVVFHSGNIGDSLANYFRLEDLPRDLGGTAPPMDNTHNVTQLRGMENFFVELNKYGYKD